MFDFLLGEGGAWVRGESTVHNFRIKTFSFSHSEVTKSILSFPRGGREAFQRGRTRQEIILGN